MEQHIYLSLDAENFIIIWHHVLFAISTFVNAVATFCLFKQAPEMQSEIKFYLYYMQVLCLLSDVLFDVAVEPFTLLPILGGYCKGLTCEWISIRFSLVFTILLLCNVGFCMLSSLWCRHQAIIKGTFKFGNITKRIVPVVFFTIVSVPGIFGSVIEFDESQTDSLVDLYNISWIRARGRHLIYKRTSAITLVLPVILFVVITATAATGCTMVSHIMWHVRRGTQRSSKSSKRLLRALLVLSIQLGLPIGLISLPAVLFICCLMDGNILTFGVCYSCVFLVNTHSLIHGVVLLAITPAYRRFISHVLLRLVGRASNEKPFFVRRSQTEIRTKLR